MPRRAVPFMALDGGLACEVTLGVPLSACMWCLLLLSGSWHPTSSCSCCLPQAAMAEQAREELALAGVTTPTPLGPQAGEQPASDGLTGAQGQGEGLQAVAAKKNQPTQPAAGGPTQLPGSAGGSTCGDGVEPGCCGPLCGRAPDLRSADVDAAAQAAPDQHREAAG